MALWKNVVQHLGGGEGVGEGGEAAWKGGKLSPLISGL